MINFEKVLNKLFITNKKWIWMLSDVLNIARNFTSKVK
jgi:hypothetical protein